jgi:hypothetical protein
MIDILLAGLLLAQTPPAVPPAPPVPPLIAAQVESHMLRTQLYTQTLSIERERIEAAIAASLPGWRMDWAVMRLVPAEKGSQR